MMGLLGRLADYLAPLAVGLLAVLLDVLPLTQAGGMGLAPLLTWCVAYFWTVHAPDRLPAPSLFVLGLLLDALSGTPLGFGALTLLLVRALVLGGRRFLLGQPFVLVWLAFALVLLPVSLARWLLATTFWQHVFPMTPSLAEAALTFAVYPAVDWLLARLHPHLAPTPDAARTRA